MYVHNNDKLSFWRSLYIHVQYMRGFLGRTYPALNQFLVCKLTFSMYSYIRNDTRSQLRNNSCTRGDECICPF